LVAAGIVREYYMTDAGGDIAKQIADMRDLITRRCDAIIITAASPDALSPVSEEAMAAGMVVVSFDNYVTTDKITAKVGIDEVEFGRVGARWLVDQLGGSGNIVVLNGVAGTGTNEMRNRGAMSIFSGYPNIRILGEAFAGWDYAEARFAIESFLSAYPQIDGIWSQGGAMTLAAIHAFEAAGRRLVPMTSEANNGLLRAWKENLGSGFDSIAPSAPTSMGASALDTAIDALNGEPVQLNTIIPLPLVTSADLDRYVRMDLPDSFWNITNLNSDQINALFR